MKNKKPPSRERESLLLLLIFFTYLLLSLNILYSQNIWPGYTGLAEGDRKTVISYLVKIKKLPIFNEELKKQKEVFGDSIEEQVYEDEKARYSMVNNLEQILKNNPKSRDVLYSLFLLYRQLGDEEKAIQYFKKAREVDPDINYD